ncbi:AMP-binding protein [Ramlibacter sp.]|uniref:AMP-binding protein n=1 Tax=Ramlibacter sp. TaxID=1917967 RepID=UPI003D107691
MFVEGNFNPPWFNPAMPSRERSVLAPLLDHWASKTPDRVFAVFEDGEQWTWVETRAKVLAVADGLYRLGVRRGDPVSAWLPNGKTMLLIWFATNYLGALFCPINTSFRGNLLAHVIRNTGAKLMVCHAGLMERLHDIDLAQLEAIVISGDHEGAAPGARRLYPESALQGDANAVGASPPTQPWDPFGIIYTSGTTGPSKGVLVSYLQLYSAALVGFGYMGPDDRILVNLPMFHVGGTNTIFAALVRGASFLLVDGFDSRKFWKQVKEFRCTTTGLVGAMTEFLSKAPPAEGEKDNPLTLVALGPVTPQTVLLAERYGFRYKTGFNMTEVSCPLVAGFDTRAFGSCGKPRDGIECRLVDEHDQEVPDGQLGELVVRSDLPWVITSGYNGMPEATAKAWRNGWFHTGDVFRKDAQGNYFFVDRAKDTIRRRGENISSQEVECEVLAHPAVQEAAAIPVKSADGEDDVMVVLATRPGASVDAAELLQFLIPRMAHFMLPRYVRFMPALPKTVTNKIQKAELRKDGVTFDTWDRDAAGIVVKRQKLLG